MTRFVITPDVAIRMAEDDSTLRDDVKLVAPTLIRSQVLTILFGRVRSGELDEAAARGLLDDIRGRKMRLLGDRVLQNVAWQIATELGWSDTYDAEYIALTRLQADALVTLDPDLRTAAATVVPLAEYGDLIA